MFYRIMLYDALFLARMLYFKSYVNSSREWNLSNPEITAIIILCSGGSRGAEETFPLRTQIIFRADLRFSIGFYEF